jgi:NADPH-dependent glutamate synthase beta subunit-like oxidoreductase
MNCKGEDQGYENFMPGVDFLARAARGEKPLKGSRVTVVSGVNVAMDCVRTGWRRPVPVEGSEFVMACDAVIPAIGQACAVQLEKMA